MRDRLAAPPRPEPRPRVLRAHGRDRVDEWHWLAERDDPEVIAHLRAENAHTEAALAHLAPLRKRLFEEIRSRVREPDDGAPEPDGPYEYFTRTVPGGEHPLLCRRRRGGGQAELLLDPNHEAAGHRFFALGEHAVSPDHRRLAYTVDREGSERFALHVRDLDRGIDLADAVDGVFYGLAWSADSRSLWYVRADDSMRAHQVWRHRIDGPSEHDHLVLDEPDVRFAVVLRRCRSGRYAVVRAASRTTSECWLLDVHDPEAPPRSVAGRRPGVLYSVEHQAGEGGDRLLLLTNEDAPDFRVVAAPADDPRPERWEELAGHEPGRRIVAVDAFAHAVVLTERGDARDRLRVRTPHGELAADPPDPVRAVALGPNREYGTRTLRYVWSSLRHEREHVDLDIETGTHTLVKREEVLGGHDPDRYVTERLWATAPDGARIPISLVRPAGPLDAPLPLLLYGYGAYEHVIDPAFSPSLLSLLERGVAYAIAHVRGGGEMGRRWYEDGRLLRKRNTFDDFVACAEHLVAAGITAPDRMVARGRSAGGLLVGAVANMRPDLFRAVVAEVPFVDALTTMLDPALPLTVTEWEEWGDPLTDAEAYDYIRSYSPYDNVTEAPYPAMLVTASLHDARVLYSEAAKWVLRLRDHTTSGAPVLLRCNLGAGHFGPPGRYAAWQDEAYVLAFVLDRLDLDGLHRLEGLDGLDGLLARAEGSDSARSDRRGGPPRRPVSP
jgi:oligopeptidase B